MPDSPITLYRGDAPLVSFTATLSTGGAYPLTGATMVCYLKASADTVDASAFKTYVPTITDGPNGKFTVQFDVAGTTSPGKFFYKVVATIGGLPVTVARGDLLILSN
jgi:hypothetical protein